MRKIRLDLDGLVVETFGVHARPGDGQGTVHAHSAVCDTRVRCQTSWQEDCPLTIYTEILCTDYCEPGPGETQYCPEEVAPTLVDPGC